MRRDQVVHFIYPVMYFLVRTVNQWRKQEPITWGRKCDDDGDNDGHHLFLYLDVELVQKAVSMGEEE